MPGKGNGQKKAPREDVVAWMEANNASAGEAAKQFGYTTRAVNRWLADRMADGTIVVKKRPESARAKKKHIDDLAESDRDKLLGFKERVLNFLDSDDLTANGGKTADALARALTNVSREIDGILTIDERARGNDGSSTGDQEAKAERLRRALREQSGSD